MGIARDLARTPGYAGRPSPFRSTVFSSENWRCELAKFPAFPVRDVGGVANEFRGRAVLPLISVRNEGRPGRGCGVLEGISRMGLGAPHFTRKPTNRLERAEQYTRSGMSGIPIASHPTREGIACNSIRSALARREMVD